MRECSEDGARRVPRVLVVEPEEETCQNLVRILEDAGAEVLTAGRAMQALELFARERVDLVLAAANLQDLAGAEFLKRVTGRSLSVRVALMAQWRSRSQFEQMMEAGLFAFLRKPVREREVLQMLGQFRAEVDLLE